jgi:hypothetical protein
VEEVVVHPVVVAAAVVEGAGKQISSIFFESNYRLNPNNYRFNEFD